MYKVTIDGKEIKQGSIIYDRVGHEVEFLEVRRIPPHGLMVESRLTDTGAIYLWRYGRFPGMEVTEVEEE